MAGNKIKWEKGLYTPDTFYVYKSDSPINLYNLPTPIATLNGNINTYEDTDSIILNQTYYYRVDAEKKGLYIPGYKVQYETVEPEYIYVRDRTIKKIEIKSGSLIWQYDDNLYRGIDIDDNGNIYGADLNYVRKIDSQGNSIFYNSFGAIETVAVHRPSGDFYIGRYNTPMVKKINSFGNEVTSGGWPFSIYNNDVEHLAVSSNTGEVYIAVEGNGRGILVDSSGNINNNYNNGYMKIPQYVKENSNYSVVYGVYGNDKLAYTNGLKISAQMVETRGNIDDMVIYNDSRFHFISQDTDGSNLLRTASLNRNVYWTYQHPSKLTCVGIDSLGNSYCGTEDNQIIKVDSSGNQIVDSIWPLQLSQPIKQIIGYKP